MDREELIAALERHGTEGADRAAQALRAGTSFRVGFAGTTVPVGEILDIWTWRAACMAKEGILTCKDFEQGLPHLWRAGDALVAMRQVGMGEDSHLVFLTPDLSSCVAVL
ncbi:hypothetical protein [Kitasatospora purpeofusca]|uniref:hypothetical protein n=1 Tax=Kitasatospora purpeofusca TaxID=67352 RepID=UPI00364D5094